METHISGAAHPAPRRSLPVAAVIALVTVLGLSVVLMLGDSLETHPWLPGGLVVVGFLLCLAGGMATARTRE